MAVIDLSRQRSPKTVAKAVSAYGATLSDPIYHLFGQAIADGETATAAFLRFWPGYSEKSAASEASVLLAHPNMAGIIRGHIGGARSAAQAVAPAMVAKLAELSETATKEDVAKINAANSLLDRGGLPRSKELAISVGTAATEGLAAFDDVVDVEPVTDDEVALPVAPDEELPLLLTDGPGGLEDHAHARAQLEGLDEIEAARAQWAEFATAEVLRTPAHDGELVAEQVRSIVDESESFHLITEPHADETERGTPGTGGVPAVAGEVCPTDQKNKSSRPAELGELDETGFVDDEDVVCGPVDEAEWDQ